MLKRFTNKLNNLLSHDIGIDLGTANTLVYVRERGIVINEPSVVAVNQKTGKVVAVGSQAKDMLGRTPGHVIAVKPLVEGVISDFEVAEEMLAYLINKAQEGGRRLLGPRVVIGVPSGITNVETRAVVDAARNAGARFVLIVEESMAAAIGIRLPVHDPVGSMVIDIGGGTCDIVIIALNGVVRAKSIKIAGDTLNNDIISYIRNEFKILIGEKTAEAIKIAVGSVADAPSTLEATVRGRDLVTGLPREVIITDADVREAISQSIQHIVDAAKEVLETTPPEILADVMIHGAHVVGGGALLRGLPSLLSNMLKLRVTVADDPLSAVVRGCGIILENPEHFAETLIDHEEHLSPQQ